MKIHKRSTALEPSVKYFTGGLKRVLRCTNLTLSSDVEYPKVTGFLGASYNCEYYDVGYTNRGAHRFADG